jgi:predicted GIY-YIG superfamily endonuclease
MNTYLLCFADNPIAHARHYIGKAEKLDRRLRLHNQRRGAKLLREVRERGGHWRIARIWIGDRERELKRQKNAPRLCPYCNAERWQKQKLPIVNQDLVRIIERRLA